MLKRFKLLKTGLQQIVISEQWSSYKDDDVQKAQFVKDILLYDNWWKNVDYIFTFINHIYDVLRKIDKLA
ncbi:unnamed protein product [Lathyrus sativus]|nr:unnamed protein product [Lathyrus sativus]